MQPAGLTKSHDILFYRQGQLPLQRRDRLISEEPLEIKLVTGPLNQGQTRSFVVTLRTPGDDYALAAGLLFAEGVIQRRQDILKMTYCVGNSATPQQYNQLRVRLHPDIEVDWEQFSRQRDSHGSCGLCGKTAVDQIQQLAHTLHPDLAPASPLLPVSLLWGLSAQMMPRQKNFQKTGGVHAAALFDVRTGQLQNLSEDVGRHNALDKLLGAEILADRLPTQQLLWGVWVSGRLSFELIQKTLRARIPIVVAVGAPSSLAIELAAQHQQTVIGFLKSDRFNVYSGAERLQSAESEAEIFKP